MGCITKDANLVQGCCWMLNIGQDIHPLSDFKRRTGDILRQLRTTRRPVVLTLNGRPQVVVQDAAAYQTLLTRLEECELELRHSRAPGQLSS